MTGKKPFGSFIRTKRTEKNYSQKDLAELLFVTEGAVSKWERGVSYPDITLISDICRVLEISEHELITASTDTDTRKMKQEAQKFRMIRSTWFWVPTISYAVALLTCFICNLAVNQTLLVLYRINRADLCILLCPNLYLLFQLQKAACFFCFDVSFNLSAFTCLYSIYEWILLVFNGLHRCFDRVCGRLRPYPFIADKNIPLQVYNLVCRGLGFDDFTAAEHSHLESL